MSTRTDFPDAAMLVLRLSIGGLLLFHGVFKIREGIEPIMTMLTNAGLPGAIAYGVFIGEIVVPLMLIAGWLTRIAAVVLALTMAAAIGLAFGMDATTLAETGAPAAELPLLYLFAAIALALGGAGRFSMDERFWR
jgi:putative oxidoreductase